IFEGGCEAAGIPNLIHMPPPAASARPRSGAWMATSEHLIFEGGCEAAGIPNLIHMPPPAASARPRPGAWMATSEHLIFEGGCEAAGIPKISSERVPFKPRTAFRSTTEDITCLLPPSDSRHLASDHYC